MTYREIEEAASFARQAVGEAPIAIVLGSGLGDYAATLTDVRQVDYRDIPHFPVSTAPGHAGRLISGAKEGKRVIMMSGRFHMYEGIPLELIALPIRVLKLLGVRTLILTNAAGGVNLDYRPGDLMLIDDYINLTGKSPLTGPNMDEFGPRFPDMSQAFSRELRAVAQDAARETGLALRHGVYCWMPGPCYESPAEIRMIRLLGADAVGMSTVPDTMVARHAGMEVLGISCITNMAAGVLDQPITHEEVLEAGRQVQAAFRGLIDRVVAKV
ncbi:MAG: purine-nucleoside phosphorylase [Clostridia bacterium]|nr:purine-nucleoside phosphorylase [Clostridia bacterium]